LALAFIADLRRLGRRHRRRVRHRRRPTFLGSNSVMHCGSPCCGWKRRASCPSASAGRSC